MARQQKKLRELVTKRKTESFQAISLMAEQVKRRQAKEARKDGLVILQAEYGHLPRPSRHSNEAGNIEDSSKIADVTVPVAALVDQGQLVIPGQVIKVGSGIFHSLYNCLLIENIVTNSWIL